MARTNFKVVSRKKRIKRIRKKLSGTAETPRLRVFKSSKHIYAQLIDDVNKTTIGSMSTLDKSFTPAEDKGKIANAFIVGKFLAEKVTSLGVSSVVFDRGGNIYHGRIKALADGAREGGLKF
jgi:large subunit ribosomal protein L18